MQRKFVDSADPVNPSVNVRVVKITLYVSLAWAMWRRSQTWLRSDFDPINLGPEKYFLDDPGDLLFVRATL